MSQDRLHQMIMDVYETHADLHKEIAKGQRWESTGSERSEIVASRNRFHTAFDRLFSARLAPLRVSFLRDAVSSVNEVIDFLEIDIPAFRCGYEKEWYLGKLKSVSLNPEQQSRLRRIALDLLRAPNYRRERREWSRLMIVVADASFVTNLKTLSSSPDHFTQQNARRMLKTVLDNRRDLSIANQTRDA